MTDKTERDAHMPVVASRRQFVLGTAAFMACAALPFPVFAATGAAQQIADHFSSVKTMMGEFVQFGPRGEQTGGKFFIERPVLANVIAVLIVGTNGTIAVLLPYTAENYPLGTRGRATGLVAGSSKFGGVAVQIAALAGFAPTLVGAALTLLVPTVVSAGLIAWFGRETQGRSLRELEAE